MFESRFVDNPNRRDPLEFPTDPDVNEKLEIWKECFMAKLIDVHRMPNAMAKPEAFRQLEQHIQARSDHCGKFLQDCVQEDEGNFTEVRSMFMLFTTWQKHMNLPRQLSVDQFEKNLCNVLGPVKLQGDRKGWRVRMRDDTVV
jgi:phage/plasmid-associated DNA primase